METPELRVVVADESHLDALGELIRGNREAEDHPDDLTIVENAPEGMRQSLRLLDALSSDCTWFLIAFYGDRPVWPFSRESRSSMHVWDFSISTNSM